MKGKKVFITAGAGIVADSDPALEYQETLNKARAMFKAVELAETWRKR
jgi:anthranilate synthase component 1